MKLNPYSIALLIIVVILTGFGVYMAKTHPPVKEPMWSVVYIISGRDTVKVAGVLTVDKYQSQYHSSVISIDYDTSYITMHDLDRPNEAIIEKARVCDSLMREMFKK